MELSKSLQALLIDIGEKPMLNLIQKKTWIIRLHTARGDILGVSRPFKLPSSISMLIIKTGTLDHAIMVEVWVSITEQIKRISGLLSDMKKSGRTEEEMMKCVERVNLDEPQENNGNYLKFKCGSVGSDLNCASLDLVAGNSFTIDSLEIH